MKLTGFTPLSDLLVKRHGLITAAVYGKVWRYQDAYGKCTASAERIGSEIGVSDRTVYRHLTTLENDGYLTINRRPGHSSIIWVTGKLSYRTVVEEVVDDESELASSQLKARGEKIEPPIKMTLPDSYDTESEVDQPDQTAMTESRTTPDRESDPPMTESQTTPDRESDEDTIQDTDKDTKKRESKETRAHRLALVSAISQSCKMSLSFKPEKARAFKIAKELQENGVTDSDVRSFVSWWYRDDWRGKKGQPPTPEQILKLWGQYQTQLTGSADESIDYEAKADQRRREALSQLKEARS